MAVELTPGETAGVVYFRGLRFSGCETQSSMLVLGVREHLTAANKEP